MTDHWERLGRIDVVAASPDDSVRVRMRGANGDFSVAVTPTGFADHTEQTLARQLGEAVHRAVMAHDAVGRRIFAEAVGAASVPDGPTGDRLDRWESAAAAIEVLAVSPWGYVRVTWRGGSDIRFRLRPRTLRLLDPAGLSAETAAALTEARRLRHLEQAQAHLRSFDRPPTER